MNRFLSIMRIAAVANMISLALLIISPSTAVAQSGSTGGAIGKQYKSISGGEEGPAARPRRAPKQSVRPRTQDKRVRQTTSACARMAGVWAFNNGLDVVMKSDGTAAGTNGDTGTWTCDAGMATVRWRRHTDRYTVSSDGNRLTGRSGVMGMALSAVRK